MRTATHAPVNPGQRGEGNTEKIKRRNGSEGKCEAYGSDCFITSRTSPNAFVATHHATAAAKSPKKFHIFHNRHVWKPAGINKRFASAENSVIAASHPQHKPRVMRKAVRQPVYGWRGRQTDPEETTTDFWIAHYARNLVQRFHRHFGVSVQKPENIAACCIGSKVHLFCTAAHAATNNPIAEAFRQPVGAVSASTINNNNFCPTGSLAQTRQKWPYQPRLIKDRNNNGNPHRRFLSEPSFAREGKIAVSKQNGCSIRLFDE
jgi:hypothetical protein